MHRLAGRAFAVAALFVAVVPASRANDGGDRTTIRGVARQITVDVKAIERCPVPIDQCALSGYVALYSDSEISLSRVEGLASSAPTSARVRLGAEQTTNALQKIAAGAKTLLFDEFTLAGDGPLPQKGSPHMYVEMKRAAIVLEAGETDVAAGVVATDS